MCQEMIDDCTNRDLMSHYSTVIKLITRSGRNNILHAALSIIRKRGRMRLGTYRKWLALGMWNVELKTTAIATLVYMHSLASALCMYTHLGSSANRMHTRNIK